MGMHEIPQGPFSIELKIKDFPSSSITCLATWEPVIPLGSWLELMTQQLKEQVQPETELTTMGHNSGSKLYMKVDLPLWVIAQGIRSN